jgi:hypothetical protein
MKEIVKLTSQSIKGSKELQYVIRKFIKPSIMGSIWSNLESGTKEEMEKSFNSEKYSNCKKIIEI